MVAHDFSLCADAALSVAAGLARRFDATIILVHVSPMPPNLPKDAMVAAPGLAQPLPIEEALTTGAYRSLAAVGAPIRASGIAVETIARVTATESPAKGLLDLANEVHPDVIVLGTHGRTGIAHLLVGSVAEKIVRGAQVPVITVRATDNQTHQTREESAAEDELEG